MPSYQRGQTGARLSLRRVSGALVRGHLDLAMVTSGPCKLNQRLCEEDARKRSALIDGRTICSFLIKVKGGEIGCVR
jgi:hypothetical protein